MTVGNSQMDDTTTGTTTMKMLSYNERRKLNSGPRVTFIVGYQRKVYYLAKSLIAKYSPILQALVANTKDDRVYLQTEKIEDFDLLFDLLSWGTVPGTKNSKSSIVGSKKTISQCLSFLEFAEKYELGDPSEVLYAPLHKAIKELSYYKDRNSSYDIREAAKLNLRCGIDDCDIEVVFRVCPPESRLRGLFAQAALSYSGIQDLKQWEDQMNNTPGFAKELMGQCVSGFARQLFTDPFTRRLTRV